MSADRVYDFASIDVSGIIQLLRRLTVAAARHVLADGKKPNLSVAEAETLSPVVMRPQYGAYAKRRAHALLARPLRLSSAPSGSPSFGPLELVAATASLSRIGKRPLSSRFAPRGGVDAGEMILKTLARIAFSEPAFREEISIFAYDRLAREVVLTPPIPLPLLFDDATLLTLVALTVPRDGTLHPRGVITGVEAGLIADATERLAPAPLVSFDAWLLAEATEALLVRRPPKPPWRTWFYRRVDRSALVTIVAASKIAMEDRYPMLASHSRGANVPGGAWPLGDDTPGALKSYLVRHF